VSTLILAPNAQRRPLRTLTELCAELNVTRQKMVDLLRRTDAPAKMIRSQSQFVGNTYFEPIEFRRWFKNIATEQFA